MVRKEGFAVLSARNIAKQIGCSTQPIYWCYKNMDDLKAEICKKALPFLQSVVLQLLKNREYSFGFRTWIRADGTHRARPIQGFLYG